MRIKLRFLWLFLSGFSFVHVNAAEIEQVIVVTDKIIIVHFDEGDITYPNNLDTVKLNMLLAVQKSSYFITSSDDANYSGSVEPVVLNRRTFGSAFQANSGGVWAGNRYNPTGKPWVTEHWIYLTLSNALQEGKTYTVNTGSLAETSNEFTFTYNVKSTRSEAVHVNTIGYSTNAPKYGYVYHWAGDLGGVDFSAYDGKTFNIYNVNDLNTSLAYGTLVFRKAADNAETSQTGDTPNQNFLGSDVYECDFSTFIGGAKGEKYILVVDGLGCSYPFEVGPDAMWDAYYFGFKALYHQRSGIRLEEPYAHEGYYRPVTQNPLVIDLEHADPTYHSISFEDKFLYSNLDYAEWADGNGGGNKIDDIIASALGNPVNVAGWYHDAGDWDAYSTHQRIPPLLMFTYEYFPERFADDELTLPESGNGIPDIIDEASWLIKFNYRLRRELKKEGYSDGGVGGARVCPDVYNDSQGSAESNKPSWKDHRNYVITAADAWMTYHYAGQAAQLAYILKSIGKDPENFSVENLDAIKFEEMTHDTVNWIREAKEAYEWASAPENQPLSESHPHMGDLGAIRMYAAAALYRLTGETKYHTVAKAELNKVRSSSNWGDDKRFGPYLYLKTHNWDIDQELVNDLKDAAIRNGEVMAVDAALVRACRNGGIISMPMLIGQATTPWMFEAIVAYALSGDNRFKEAVHTTADYYMGNNPRHTTWMVNVGPRPVKGGFHLDTRNTGWNQVYSGWIPYGPWSIKYSSPLFTWTIDGIEKVGGMGSWSEQWANYSVYPVIEEWPGHERWNNNIHSPLYAENTVHQNAVHAGLTYGFVNARHYANGSSTKKISAIVLDTVNISFTLKKETTVIGVDLDIENAICPQLVWSSNDESVAHVNDFGRVTAMGNGVAVITCSTLDGSVNATCNIICDNLADIPVQSIEVSVDSLDLGEGQRAPFIVDVQPDNATVKSCSFTSLDPLIADVVDNEVLAYSAGQTKIIVVSDDNPELTDTIYVSVRQAGYLVITDFDNVIPVTTEPQPFDPQFFSLGPSDINADNPLVNSLNPSQKVVKTDLEGTWKLCGIVLPTKEQPRLCRYDKLEFKYYSADINHFMVTLIYEGDSKTEIRQDVTGQDDWQIFSVDLPADGFLKTILIFPNPEETALRTCYFDDFRLTEDFSKDCFDQILVTNFETLILDWQGAGSYSWSSNTNGIVVNPLVDTNNPSPKVFRWYKDAQETSPNAWGGFGIDFNGSAKKGNEKSTTMWESMEFLVYSTESFSTFQVELTCTDENENQQEYNKYNGKIQFDKSIIANQWNTVSFKFSDLSDEVPEFNKLTMLPAGGENKQVDIYIDSIILKGFAVQSITIDGERDYQMGIGEEFQLSATVSPIDAEQGVVWKTSNSKVATVSTTGLITTVGGGLAYIIAISRGNPKLADTLSLLVGVPLLDMAIEGDPIRNLLSNSSIQLNIIYTPSDATETDVDWTSSDESIAVVSPDGLVTGIGKGTVVITATSKVNNSLKASVDINVEYPSSIENKAFNGLQIFPNPAHEEITIKSDQMLKNIEVFNLSGNKLISISCDGCDNVSVDLKQIPAGFYFLKITDIKGHIENRKIIIQ